MNNQLKQLEEKLEMQEAFVSLFRAKMDKALAENNMKEYEAQSYFWRYNKAYRDEMLDKLIELKQAA